MSAPYVVSDWKWDRVAATTTAEWTCTRWRRGPVTFYLERVQVGGKFTHSYLSLCPWDDVLLGVRIPDRVGAWLQGDPHG